MTYADNLRKAIVNTGRVFTAMAEEVRRKQMEADRKELDTLWQQALTESIKDGEQFTRYHFANLVAAAEREACAKLCEYANKEYEPFTGRLRALNYTCADLIRARGTE